MFKELFIMIAENRAFLIMSCQAFHKIGSARD